MLVDLEALSMALSQALLHVAGRKQWSFAANTVRSPLKGSTFNLVTTSKAPVTTSVALVSNSFLLLLVRHLLLLAWHLFLIAFCYY